MDRLKEELQELAERPDNDARTGQIKMQRTRDAYLVAGLETRKFCIQQAVAFADTASHGKTNDELVEMIKFFYEFITAELPG
jgi:hypothetical protein